MRSQSTPAQAAKLIRQELKEAFPATAFRVTSERYAGGSSVYVSWVNGPLASEVKEIINKFQYGSFDAMEDIYRFNNKINGLPQVSYVFAQREVS